MKVAGRTTLGKSHKVIRGHTFVLRRRTAMLCTLEEHELEFFLQNILNLDRKDFYQRNKSTNDSDL